MRRGCGYTYGSHMTPALVKLAEKGWVLFDGSNDGTYWRSGLNKWRLTKEGSEAADRGAYGI